MVHWVAIHVGISFCPIHIWQIHCGKLGFHNVLKVVDVEKIASACSIIDIGSRAKDCGNVYQTLCFESFWIFLSFQECWGNVWGDIPLCHVSVKGREEIIESLVGPVWTRECCLETLLTFFQFAFPTMGILCSHS